MPQSVAARKPITGELATLSATRPTAARRHETHRSPTDDSLWTMVPAKWRMTNMSPLT